MNNLPLFTMGQIEINILGYPTILNITPNEVPIDEDGVLSSEFFRENKVNINYVSKFLEIQNKLYPFKSTQILTSPTRTVKTFYIPIENTEKAKVTYLDYILAKEFMPEMQLYEIVRVKCYVVT